MKTAVFKVVEVGEFWKYHIYRRYRFGWWKIGGRDRIESCEAFIKRIVNGPVALYYDAQGNRIKDEEVTL